ncbi:MAG: HlyD family efflux transporter periplasmic adaptor subunit [Bacteroidaceae bacterium]|nr:HlyD family efflux transporter periplasmic adaptor subunit [Bacteroidaceae bacterium]
MNTVRNEENLMFRSEEVQDIIERMPTGWTRYVSLVVTALLMVMVVLSVLITYPDTVIGEVTLTSEVAPVRLVATSTGRLHLLHADGDSVCVGDIIAFVDDGALLPDILLLDSLLGRNAMSNEPLPSLVLGNLSSMYNEVVFARQQLEQLRSTSVYKNMLQSLDAQIQVHYALAEIQKRQLLMNEGDLQLSRLRLVKDSILHNEGAISDEDMEHRYSAVIAFEQRQISQESNFLSTQSEIQQNQIEKARVSINEKEELNKALNYVRVKEDELRSSLRQWKERYLLTSAINGRLEYLGFWRENEMVTPGKILFTVLPFRGNIFGEAHISALGFGKVEVGQRVSVKLENYPYDEFGHLEGRVKHISHLKQSVQTLNGNRESYLVLMDFPKGLQTNYGVTLDVGYEAHGSAEIITEPKRLIERLFDNLKSQQGK